MYKSCIRRRDRYIIKWIIVIKSRYIDIIFVKLDRYKIVLKTIVLKKEEKRKKYRININIRNVCEHWTGNNTLDI